MFSFLPHFSYCKTIPFADEKYKFGFVPGCDPRTQYGLLLVFHYLSKDVVSHSLQTPFEQIQFLGLEPLLLCLKANLVTTVCLTRTTSFVTLTQHSPTLACSHETWQSTEISTSEGNVRLAFLPSQTASYFIYSIHRSKFSECETWTKPLE
jgi:hypothetical protein